ncbi:TonB-dependent receptor domain-containing protein [Thiomicrospira sp.]|uniref:TonB-dependent receptor domain-containing protein n=1 Tax=Thiomicrospira sp. TaxID=935 RepID=UPI002F937098
MTPRILTLAILGALSHSALAENQLLPIQVISEPNLANSQDLNKVIENSGNTEGGAVLRQFSGVEAQRLGGIGLDILVRGQGQSAVNILIDGGKIEGGCPNRMDPPTHYTELSSFDKITVLKGVQSLQYGVGGTAGTVLLEREKPAFDDGQFYNGQIHAATNSNGLSRDIGAEVALGNEQMYLVLQGSNKSADNYKDGNGDEVRSSYQTQQGHIDLGWTPSQDHHVKLSHETSNTQDALYQGAGMDALKSDGSMTRLSYEGKNRPGLVNEIKLSAYQSQVDHVMDNFSLREPTDPTKKMETPTEVTTFGAKINLTSNLKQTRLDYGLMLQTMQKQATLYNRAPTPDKSVSYMWPNTIIQQNSAFVEADSALSNTQNLIYGVRIDQVTAQAKDANQATDLGPSPAVRYNQVYGSNYAGEKMSESNWNGLIRYEQTLSSLLAWFGGLSLTTRTADETERFMNKTLDWVGNPDLSPEKHLQFDLGLTQQTTAFNWQANVFYDQISDYILRDKAVNQDEITNSVGSMDVGQGYVNVDAVIYGAEFDWNYQLNQAWLLGGNLALTQGRNTTDDRNLSNMAPLNGQIHTRYERETWYAGSRFNFATEQTQIDDQYDNLETAAWSTVDIFAGYQMSKTIQLQAGADNLFDHAYVTHVNRTDSFSGNLYKVMEPGRNIWARVQARF